MIPWACGQTLDMEHSRVGGEVHTDLLRLHDPERLPWVLPACSELPASSGHLYLTPKLKFGKETMKGSLSYF